MARQIAPYIVKNLGWALPTGITDTSKLLDPISVASWNNTQTYALGLESNSIESFRNLTISPNPSDGETLLVWEKAGNYVIAVTDMQGKSVLKLNGFGNSVKINKKEWQKGLYTIQMEQDKSIKKSVKLVVK